MGRWSVILDELSILLRNQFEIEHVTLQPEVSVQVLKYRPKSEYLAHEKKH